MNNSTENNNSNRKEEILAKSRQLQHDEGIEHAIAQGAKKGSYFGIEVVGFPLLMLSLITWQTLAIYALSSVISASWFGEFLAKYRVLKQKRYLIAAICFGLLGIGGIILFVRDIGILQEWWG
ncbi:MAG: DUF6442 family protein [Defluviitaleaceae bacterium]|nr:DUF6442 family protein [Defluviitaleaceae bacterium]